MEYRKLGNSGIKISALSFGTWITFGKQIDNKEADALVSTAYEHGVNFFDSAEIYARGKAEEVLGNIIQKKDWPRSSYMVSSKVFFGYEKDLPNQTGLSRKHIVEGCNAALERLKVDYIDLFFCHRPDKSTPIEETVWSMHQLIMQGKILYWGTSEWSAAEIMEAHYFAKANHLIGPTMEQPQYNMFERNKLENEYLTVFKNFGLGTTIWSPLASGVLSEKYLNNMPADTRLSIEGMDWLKERSISEEKLQKVKGLNELAKSIGTSLPKLAIAWCLKNENVSTVMLGASKIDQLKETLTALEVAPMITEDLLLKIETILKNKPILPLY
jgi:voltage-dependent potassium channel beta subunit